MISRWSRDKRRRRREEEAAKPHPHDVIMLELMRQLRPHTYGAIYDNPRSVFARALQKQSTKWPARSPVTRNIFTRSLIVFALDSVNRRKIEMRSKAASG
jgi:hypothetical protein